MRYLVVNIGQLLTMPGQHAAARQEMGLGPPDPDGAVLVEDGRSRRAGLGVVSRRPRQGSHHRRGRPRGLSGLRGQP